MKEKIKSGKTYLGIELGSTRVKAALIDDTYSVIADGSYEWENKLEGGYWTYSLEEIHKSVQGCFLSLQNSVMSKYGVKIEKTGGIGISAMMHGYLAFDKNMNLLVPFRTWRNTTAQAAAEKLTEVFGVHIPARWSIAHLYQAILNKEEHVKDISYITTLAGYVHYLLTGEWELGLCDASGMFPVSGADYDGAMLDKFRKLVSNENFEWDIYDILPRVKKAGSSETVLSESGAEFLDVSGNLKSGICVCPPEGDAATGMVATNSVLPRTGNVSGGTSVFSMLVLEKPLENLYPEIDTVVTPDGMPVAMVHCNNCCAELDSWVNVFSEFTALLGLKKDKGEIYELLYNHAMTDICDGIVACNYLSGEHLTNISKGYPMYFRTQDSKMNLAGFMKAELYAAVATLKIGMDILFEKESVLADMFCAHGGLFKVRGIAQQILANALKCKVAVMKTAGEGGAWGMALLAAFSDSEKNLGEWLSTEVFSDMEKTVLAPEENGVSEFMEYIKLFKSGLLAEAALGEVQ